MMKCFEVICHYSGTVVVSHGPDPRDDTDQPVSGDFRWVVVAHTKEEAVDWVKRFDYERYDMYGVDEIEVRSVVELEDSEYPDGAVGYEEFELL